MSFTLNSIVTTPQSFTTPKQGQHFSENAVWFHQRIHTSPLASNGNIQCQQRKWCAPYTARWKGCGIQGVRCTSHFCAGDLSLCLIPHLQLMATFLLIIINSWINSLLVLVFSRDLLIIRKNID